MASTEELFEAIDADDAAAVRRLVTADPSLAAARDGHGVSALMRALYRFEPPVVDALRDHVEELDLFEAASVGDGSRLERLLDRDPALASSYSGDGFTALHFAAFFGQPSLVALLLRRGAAIDAFGRGWMTGTALHSAVSRRQVEAVRMLLDAGANPNARQSSGWTPLHSAASNGDVASAELLLASGADPAAANDEGRTVLDMAEERGDEATIARIRSALQTTP